MSVNVFVIVALRKLPQLPTKTLTASVIDPGGAPAIAPPIAQRHGNTLQPSAAGKHRATFPHRNVMRRIKTLGSQVTEAASSLARIERTQGIAIVFDEIQIVSPH